MVIEILKENACFWNEYYKFILAITLKLKINNRNYCLLLTYSLNMTKLNWLIGPK